jgi:hypothetical protein
VQAAAGRGTRARGGHLSEFRLLSLGQPRHAR